MLTAACVLIGLRLQDSIDKGGSSCQSSNSHKESGFRALEASDSVVVIVEH